jgi:hypothetical protein
VRPFFNGPTSSMTMWRAPAAWNSQILAATRLGSPSALYRSATAAQIHRVVLLSDNRSRVERLGVIVVEPCEQQTAGAEPIDVPAGTVGRRLDRP